MTEKRVAIVTGANRGIGHGTAAKLAKDHPEWTVIATARSKEAAEEAASKIGLPNVVGYGPLSTDKQEDVDAFVAWIKEKYGRADVLVNNAGQYGPKTDPNGGPETGKTVMDLSKEDLMGVVDTNVGGPLLMTKALLPLMKEHGWGRIVNISSVMGALHDSDWKGYNAAAYRISKTALNGLTVNTSEYVKSVIGSDKIKVNSLCPGWVKTDMGTDAAALTIDESVPHITWAVDLPDDGPTGEFFTFSKPLAW
eukprot:TRINITY_DN22238_c0_g1_i1.p1 TRINITY_DN22238_c0_g1~~TRINITY_DN22238_c0_g1_i1.p1  ORF type:complete len:252 (-),score=44.74 TRINITY_DN22238_c0_g1_i1:92-847(-)